MVGAVLKALLLYMAGKAMRKYIPSNTLMLWLFLAVFFRGSAILFVVAYLLMPHISSVMVRVIWGNDETTHT
jgi:hypothetical protein